MTELAAYAQSMLALINRDRQRAGLAVVAWDAVASAAGVRHAQDMAWQGYFSHWNPEGVGPEYRYTQAGGTDAVSENVYTFYKRYSTGAPVPIDDWHTVIEEAQAALMQSPGHRRNILDPLHTHVGIGLAYAPASGQIWLAQEFLNRYVRVSPLPRRAAVGMELRVNGQLLPGASDPLVNVAHTPFPETKSIAALNRTGAYRSPAQIFAPINPQTDGSGRFSAAVRLDHRGKPGLYLVRVWVNVPALRGKALAAELVVETR